MNANDIPLDNIKNLFNELQKQTNDAIVGSFTQLASLQQQRAARLASAEDRLKASLGENHPQVIALREAATFANQLQQNLQTTLTRAQRRPQVKPGEWVVFGTVFNSQGNPVSGVQVRIFDRDCVYDDLLGDTETDEYGDFAVIYHERDFADIIEKQPDLYIRVNDMQGNELYSSQDSIRYNVGQAEFFEIILL
ncbi:hypothetical protein [Brasilonema sp. UFV-L1]|uniref:hypothetical protein n=1 Tax=Brasilonema sp. UFV-L1 TaxID=2234130 RepID=UPI00145F0478|nr:hypothetical protein [Brasilonema sp. UFV-L1]NMG08781.1 hypothetical protein [Brasilonema sp. UFV-L1]